MTRIYMSSTFSARDDRRDDLTGLRLHLQSRAESFGVDLVLAEQDGGIDAARKRGDIPSVLEGCARRMSSCDAFFGMLFERHGDRIQLDHGDGTGSSAVSIFEAELLHASMAGKPILVAQSRELPPGPELAAFLRIVDGALRQAVRVVDRRSLPGLFDDFCQAVVRGQIPGGNALFDDLSVARVRRSRRLEVRDPLLRFGNGMLVVGGPGKGDAAVVRSAVARVQDGVASDGRALGQLEKLSFLWLALREISLVPVRERLADLAAETDRALGLWNSSAAWYGIHGSHPLGCTASLNELELMRAAGGTGPPPHGARASAYYSIGARLRSRPHARRFFETSLRLSREAMALAPSDPSGSMQMVASAHARLALLGSPWRYALAVGEFRRSYRWRVDHAASEEAIGEALNAYAHALGRLPWKRTEALAMAAEASGLLREADARGEGTHYIRAERKRADLLFRAGRRDEAVAVAAAARDRAVERDFADQQRQLDSLIAGWTGHPVLASDRHRRHRA